MERGTAYKSTVEYKNFTASHHIPWKKCVCTKNYPPTWSQLQRKLSHLDIWLRGLRFPGNNCRELINVTSGTKLWFYNIGNSVRLSSVLKNGMLVAPNNFSLVRSYFIDNMTLGLKSTCFLFLYYKSLFNEHFGR